MRDIVALKIEHMAPPLRSHDVNQFQQATGLQLPSEYVRFLAQANGGNPELDSFRLNDGEEWSAGTFYHLTMNENDGEDLLWAFKTYKQVLPPGVLPIAFDGGGNQICLDLRPGAKVGVVVWDHEDMGQVRPAVDTFTELIDRLYLNPDYV